MATATIPELIQPGTLYAPDDTAVSVDPGWCPNGDDGLSIDGSAANFRAYQPAISGIHYPTNVGDPFALVFWATIGGLNSGSGTAAMPAGTIAGVMDINLANDGERQPNDFTTGIRWVLATRGAASNGRLILQMAVGASSSAYIAQGTGISPTIQHQYAFLMDSSTRSLRFDGANNPTPTTSAGLVGTPGALTSPYFAIGPYATTSGWSFPSRVVKLGKFAIFNYLLSDTELSDLYTAMTLGPPSP